MKKVMLTMSLFGAISLVAGTSGADPKYGTAGCGLGSMILGDKPGIMQIFAATTNGTSGNQTFGITSGTSNCDSGSKSSESTKAFVEANRTALAKEAARGRGETIASLTELAGCSNSAAVGAKLQKSFKSVFPSAKATDTQVSSAVVDLLKSDTSLSCTNLI
jgi:hypothetical protein